MEKGYTNFGQNEIWEIVEIGVDMYTYSWSGRKKTTFSKTVCPSAKFVCTKTWERIKIIACGFFCLKGVYRESKFDPIARRSLKPKEIFNDFSMSRNQINEIDPGFLKIWTRKQHLTRLDPIARRLPKLEPNESTFRHILVSK